MTTPFGEGWTPGAAEDLTADALKLGVQVSPRMIVDWTEHGLLGAPAFSKSTQHGSNARLYSPQQRRLFTEMLQMRERSPIARIPHRTLSQPVLAVWLNEDTVVTDAQARRAWRTWAHGAGKTTGPRRSQTAGAVVTQFAHPSASYHKQRAARLLIEQGEKSRRPDWEKIYWALTEVCSPWPAGPGQHRIERSIGTPELPAGVQEFLVLRMIQQKITRCLATEEIPEIQLAQARLEHRRDRAWYSTIRPTLQARATTNPEMFDEPPDPQGQIKEQLDGFVLILGHMRGLMPEVQAQVRSFGPRRR